MSARHVNRATVHWALRVTSEDLGCRPEQLDPAEYERLRTERAHVGLPSHFTIALVFGSWERACRYVGASYPSPTDEARIAHALYGHSHAERRERLAVQRR